MVQLDRQPQERPKLLLKFATSWTMAALLRRHQISDHLWLQHGLLANQEERSTFLVPTSFEHIIITRSARRHDFSTEASSQASGRYPRALLLRINSPAKLTLSSSAGDYGMSTWVTLTGGSAVSIRLDGIIYRVGYDQLQPFIN